MARAKEYAETLNSNVEQPELPFPRLEQPQASPLSSEEAMARIMGVVEKAGGTPSRIAVEVANSIALARRGGPERVFGLSLPGLSKVDPSLAGRVYSALLAPCGRRGAGAFYTPSPLARRLSRLALAGRHDPTVIDPACGGGVFLLEAGRILAKRLGDTAEAAKRLHGIDSDPGALEVCRAVLEAEGFRVPHRNLRCANSLLEPWTTARDAVSFGAVIGNPPYRNIVRVPADERRALKERFDTFHNKCDLYGLFIEAAAKHLASKGRLAMLVSSSFLGASSFAPLRRLLFDNKLLQTHLVESISKGAFPEASVDVVALVARRVDHRLGNRRPEETRRTKVHFTEVTPRGAVVSAASINARELKRRCLTSAALPADPKAMKILDQMAAAGVPMGELANLSLGIKTGNDKRFVMEGRSPPGVHWVPCVQGRHVRPWKVSGSNTWLDYRPEAFRSVHGARPRRRESFDRPAKLLLRETSGSRLIAAMDHDRRFPLDTLHAITSLSHSPVSLWYLLAFLNAYPTSFWYGLHHPGPHVKASEVRALPIPLPPSVSKEASNQAMNDAMTWIEGTTPSCSAKTEREPTTDTSDVLKGPASCRQPNALAPLLEMLAQLLSRESRDQVCRAAQDLLDDTVALAYGVELSLLKAFKDETKL